MYRTRTLGGSFLVIKGCNDCVTIERGSNGKPAIVSKEGDWSAEELEDARDLWRGPAGREARMR